MTEAGVSRLIAATRRAFQALRATGDALHADLGVTASLRAVLEHLEAEGPATVPEIARAKTVSRQHIQKLADAGRAAGFLEARPNPAHRRSPLIALTDLGAETFAEIRARERAPLTALAAALGADFTDRDVATAAAALERMAETLAQDIDHPEETEGDRT